ncbi:hypothetical protein [Cryptosporangium sp. NPDC048952]|uniref:hypothetical protein n=1 Tax=Cryptosporangium sp. NPDC048952 TaxID=3363961 RepID=UPI003721EF57
MRLLLRERDIEAAVATCVGFTEAANAERGRAARACRARAAGAVRELAVLGVAQARIAALTGWSRADVREALASDRPDATDGAAQGESGLG